MTTIITKTIGQDGWQDFSAIQQATDAITTSAVANTADLVTADVAVVFDIYAGVYDESVEINESLTCDATRNVTYKPAVGSEHGGSVSKGVRISPSVGAAFHNLRDDFVTLDGLVIDCPSNGFRTIATEGVSIRNCIIDVGGIGIDASYGNTGTASAPLTVENCVISTPSRAIYFAALYGAAGPIHYAVRNCTLERTSGLDAILTLNTGDTNYGEFTNNIVLNGGFNQTGSNILTGSDNIGPAGTFSWPSALQAGSQTWTFTTDRTAASTGSQVVYDANDFSLINVAGNDAIGVGTATGAPTTDINGVDRVRGVGTQYVDPGAFTSDLFTYTRTIGPGRHYDDFVEAESAVTTIPRDTNLAQQNLAIVFEADAGTYTGTLNADSTLVTDATRNVTYKPAAGSEHGGSAGAGVIIDTGGSNRAVTLSDDFTVVDGFNLATTTTYCAWLEGAGAVAQNCIASAFNRGFIIIGGTATYPAEVRNCVSLGGSGYAFYVLSTASQDAHGRIINCTGETTTSNTVFRNQQSGGGTPPEAEFVNCLALSSSTFSESGTVTTTGSNNIGGATNSFPSAIQAEGQTWTFTTDTSAASTGSQVVYASATGAMLNVSGNDAIGVGTASAAPTTDINGVSRIRGASNEYVDPGAFSVDKITYTRTIGKDGWQDYTDFTTAEAAAVTLAESLIGVGRTNLAQRNAQGVYDVYAGTYSEAATLQIDDTLTYGPGNGVTYRAAEGNEHKGVPGDGVDLRDPSNNANTTVLIYNDYCTLDGIGVYNEQNNARPVLAQNVRQGIAIKNCLLEANYVNGICVNTQREATGSLHPLVFENNVFRWQGNYAIYLSQSIAGGGSGPGRAIVKNNTFQASAAGGVAIGIGDTGSYFDLSASNNLQLSGLSMYWSGDVRVTGKGNFDVQTAVQGPYIPFPDSMRGTGAPITVSTDITASSTGSQVIIDDTTLSTVNVSGNDIVGAGDGTQAPTTDINGVSRIRGASNEYADPGAFTTDLITATKIIDINQDFGYDYSGFIEAEDDVEEVAHELLGGTRENLAQRNGSIVFEARAGTYNESVTFDSTLVADPTRNVTYKAAAGSEHGGLLTQGVRVNGQTVTRDSFTVLDALVLYHTAAVYPGQGTHRAENGEGITYRNVIANTGSGGEPFYALNVVSVRYENCVAHTTPGNGKGWRLDVLTRSGAIALVNCTDMNPYRSILLTVAEGYSAQLNIVNFLSLAPRGFYAPNPAYTLTGSNNVGGSSEPFPAALQAEGQTWTFTTDTTASSTGSQAIYTSATGALVNVSGNDAVGVGTGTGAPTTDILGNSRIRGADNEYADPGAFTTDLVTFSKNVGENLTITGLSDVNTDKDTAATTTNLAKRNEAITYTFSPGSYTAANITKSLVCDSVRKVTVYSPPTETVIVSSTSVHGSFSLEQSFMVWDGVDVSGPGHVTLGGGSDTIQNNEGIVMKNCRVIGSRHSGQSIQVAPPSFAANRYWAGTSKNPQTIENVVLLDCTNGINASISDLNTSGMNVLATHVTHVGNASSNNFFSVAGHGDPAINPNYRWDFNVSAINCLGLTNGITLEYNLHAGGRQAARTFTRGLVGTSTGTRGPVHFGGIRLDATTSANPGAGDWSIYDASTGALLNVSGNDAIGVGDGTVAPTTDINGNFRIRGLNDEYADPGAFTSEKQTILKRVANLGLGQSESQYDYGCLADIQNRLALDAAEYLGNDRRNIAQRNAELVYEFNKGEYPPDSNANKSINIYTSNIVTGPTNRVIFRPDAESHHNGDPNQGVIFSPDGYANFLSVRANHPDAVAFVDFEGFVLKDADDTRIGYFVYEPYLFDGTINYCAGKISNILCLQDTTNGSIGDRTFVRGDSETGAGSKKYPIEVENCVIQFSQAPYLYEPGNDPAIKPTYIKFTNNTIKSRAAIFVADYLSRNNPALIDVEFNNNIFIPWNDISTHSFLGINSQASSISSFKSAITIKGSNNFISTESTTSGTFGNGTVLQWFPMPGSLRGSIYPVNYTTDTTSTSADTFIYDANNLSAVNVSGNALIGLGDSSLAPSADILSASRIRPSFGAEEVGPDYSEPGAFSTELSTITKTIGPDGDFSGFGQAESALFNDTSIIYERNLSKANLAVVVEVEAGRYTENLDTYNASFYGGPTNTVTYRAAAGSEHNGLVDSGVRLGRDAGVHSSTAASINLPYQILEGLVLLSNATNYANSVVTIASTNRRAEGVKIKNCIFSCSENIDGYGARLDCNATERPRGTEEHPIVFDNCVFLKTGIQSVRIGNGADANVQFNNCTFGEGRTVARVAASVIDGGKTYKVSWTNCIRLGDGADVNYTPGSDTTLVAGPSNLSLHTGSSDNYWPGSLTYTATTDTSAASTGNQMIYDASTLALVNVSGNDAVGVGTGSAITVPANDILGNSRIRGVNNEYADPGAFSVDKITYTKTIGLGGSANGFDFGDFTDAEAAVTTIPYAENLAERNLAIVFEADAGTYAESGTVHVNSTLTTDAARQVTYKPANGAEHGGDESAGVIVQPSTGATPFDVRDNFTVLDGLVMKGTATNANGIQTGSGLAEGVRVKNCIIVAGAYPLTLYGGGTAANPIRVESCVAKGLNTAPVARLLGLQRALFAEISNCTLLGGGTGFETYSHSFNTDASLVNNLRLGIYSGAYSETVGSGALIVTGSNNVGGSGNPFPSLLQAEGQTWTFTTDTSAASTGSQVIYASATGELVNVSGNDAVGVATASEAPTTDINGVSRLRGANNEYADPGAFTTDLVTFNKKIGPYREYTSFGDAEADVVAISTDGNLAQRNEAIVFDVDAGDHDSAVVNFTSTLITGPTNNVTYRGLKYSGLDSSATIASVTFYNFDKYTAFENISFKYNNNTGFGPRETCTVKNCGFFGVGTYGNAYVVFADGTEHVKFENCMFSIVYNQTGGLAYLTNGGTIEFLNCTFINNDFSIGGIHQPLIAQEGDGKLIANNIVNGTGKKFMYSSNQTPQKEGNNNYSRNTSEAGQLPNQTDTQFSYDAFAVATGGNEMGILVSGTPGQMLNVSANTIIGLGSVSASPTTDINGVSRLRGVGTQYADPGAFTTDVNTITKTIGIGGAASGFDFADITEAEAAVFTDEVAYSREWTKKNIEAVFDISSGTYQDNFNVSITNHNFGPGNSLTFKKAQDEVPIFSATGDLYFSVPFGTLDGLELNAETQPNQNILTTSNFNETVLGLIIKNCIFKANTFATAYRLFMGPSGAAGNQGSAEHPTIISNCYMDSRVGIHGLTSGAFAGSYFVDVVNCTFDYTFAGPGNGNHYGVDLNATDNVTGRGRIINCIDFAPEAYTGTAFNIYSQLSGEYVDNYSVNAYNPNNSATTITATTDTSAASTGNQAVYVSATGALVNVSGNDLMGAGSGSAINVPASDILGKSRLRGLSNEYADPGAYTTDIKTTTLTANPGTLSALITNLTPYITTTNIAKRNESIVIELEKADYPEIYYSNVESIIGDTVRNITIKPEEGAHHKGIRGAGIRFIAQSPATTFEVRNTKGVVIEGIEIYSPSSDVGTAPGIIRYNDGLIFKDIIWNSAESSGKGGIQSSFSNGSVSPVIFKNNLFLNDQTCLNLNTHPSTPGGKYKLINCTLSSVNSFALNIQPYQGTMEFELTNNLILSQNGNIRSTTSPQSEPQGDTFVYGSNNTGPDTPSYQLPDAIRSTLYPIEPTTDYTPVPSSPAAVYRASTLQLLDVPNNDVLQIGVGTSDSDVPTEGIGGQTRATSSCNPGCWEDNYELVDLQINTLEGVEGFRNPLRGSDTTVAFATLPDDAVPMFIVIGDSTAQGFSVTSPSATPDADSYKSNTKYWPTSAYDGSAYGYFWDKFMTSEDNGATWTKSYPDYVTTDSSGSQFLPLHPRLGGISYGTFTYSVDPDHTQLAAVGNCSPIWDFAIDISGIFKNAAGDTIAPRFVYLALPQSRLGANGPDVGGFTNFNFSPNGFLFNTLLEAYIKPAVDSVLNEGKNPVLVGVLIMTGGTEANIAYNPNPDGDKVSASGAATYVNFLSGITDRCNLNGRFPHMAYQVWDTSADPTNFPAAYTGLMRKALYSIRDTHINREPILQDLLRDKDGGPANSGVHFLQKMYPKYGQRFGTQYRSLLSMNRYPIYARTLSDIFD